MISFCFRRGRTRSSSLTRLAPINPVMTASFAPAMNSEMWAKPAVQRNVAQLRADGFHFVEPGTGWLSCGQVGQGRMAEPAEIQKAVENLLR